MLILLSKFWGAVQWVENDKDLIESLLKIDDEYPFENGDISRVILNAFRWSYSLILDEKLLDISNDPLSPYRNGAIKALAYKDPYIFFEKLPEVLSKQGSTPNKVFFAAIDLAVETLDDIYYGGADVGCPVYIDVLQEDLDELLSEYIRMQSIQKMLKRFFPDISGLEGFLSRLENLPPKASSFLNSARIENIEDKTTDFPFDWLYAFNHISNSEEKLLAIRYSAWSENKAAIPMLIQTLRDNNWFVEQAAADALYQIGTIEAIEAYEKWRRSLDRQDKRRPEFGRLFSNENNHDGFQA
jgi:hypothetical protein